MQSPDARDEHVVDALLDGGALLEDPIRMAAVLDELRARRAEPRPELRLRVAGLLAVPAVSARRRRTRPSRRRIVVGALAALAAVVIALGAISLMQGGGSQQAVTNLENQPDLQTASHGGVPRASYGAAGAGSLGTVNQSPFVVAPSPSRLQDYRASLQLRVESTRRLSQVTQRTISLTRGFGGFVRISDVTLHGAHAGTAQVDVSVPVGRVQDAIDRFSSLGVIVGQHVTVADLQASFDAAARRSESLRHSLALISVRLADPRLTPEQRVSLLAQRERARHALVGAQQTSKELAARGAYARIDLAFSTGKRAAPAVARQQGRLEHAVRRAAGLLETLAIGALFVAILAVPILLVAALVALGMRTRRRRLERALLERA